MKKTEQELLAEIGKKLDRITGLIASQGKSELQQIQLLRRMGFDWEFIGAVAGIKPDAARKRFERKA